MVKAIGGGLTDFVGQKTSWSIKIALFLLSAAFFTEWKNSKRFSRKSIFREPAPISYSGFRNLNGQYLMILKKHKNSHNFFIFWARTLIFWHKMLEPHRKFLSYQIFQFCFLTLFRSVNVSRKAKYEGSSSKNGRSYQGFCVFSKSWDIGHLNSDNHYKR